MFKLFGNDEHSLANFHPVTSAFPPSEQFGPLEPKDTEWAQLGGFATETQIWYNVFDNGVFVFCQIIHSSVGLWSPTVQFTCKVYDPASGEQTWKSTNVSKFVTPPPASGSRTYDKRSCQSEKFRVVHTPATATHPEQYRVDATPDNGVQVSLTVERPNDIPGCKIGKGPRGGYSYFGPVDRPDGFVVHRFWPRTTCSGVVMVNGTAYDAKGQGMFVHAIQGMRPNLVAERWNFGHFLSRDGDALGGVSAIMMEFTTTEAYGRRKAEGDKIAGEVKVNVGCVVVGGKLVLCTGETQWADEKEGDKTGVVSRAEHTRTALDKDTGYKAPEAIEWTWKGPALGGEEGEVTARISSDFGNVAKPNGLLEKVDVLGEIPSMIKSVVKYAAGVAAFIYQYFNPATITITLPGKEPQTVQGTLFNEASYISNP
ncbi:oxidative stress survival, Svf1-like protein [Calocera cornea HHB12733]|uniref:Oxidative stress survival, Svf1-like protein n=1 Tax=Calocera cornea HHB12733 TaxID=1353952 RepID=A0A165D7H4_9BASI|nr:oxidative stress survival, Svf1-like protein [Calocera cornea HHB12733]